MDDELKEFADAINDIGDKLQKLAFNLEQATIPSDITAILKQIVQCKNELNFSLDTYKNQNPNCGI